MNLPQSCLLTLLSTSLLGACASSEPTPSDRCASDRCDLLDLPDSEVDDSPCDGVIVDMSGRGHKKVAGRLNDPLAKFALRAGDTCPTSFQEIMAKLRANDTEGCDAANPRDGIVTRLVSETAQIMDQPTSYRAVTSRQCGEKKAHNLLFSLFGIQADTQELPPNVEIIAFDEQQGVFNYYEAERDGTLKFFGNSIDMLRGASGQTRRCASCHTGGGLIMKELDTPWLHWEGHTTTPGATELVERFENFGEKADGREFERVVITGNALWTQTRAKHIATNATTKELLRPLFCTVEVNLDTGADFSSPPDGSTEDSNLRFIPGTSLVDETILGGMPISFPSIPSGIPIVPEQYELIIKANGQRVSDIPGAVDTIFDYAFPVRGSADKRYLTQLLLDRVLDSALIQDVLMVDYTRPIFSDDRCSLLDFAPDIPPEELSPTSIRDGFVQNLSAAEPGTPAAELLANLTSLEVDHLVTTQAFIDACTARSDEVRILHQGTAEEVEVSASLFDMIALTSLNRRLARNLDVFEFPQTMPVDNLTLPEGSRLHPIDCTITNSFVAVAE